MFERLSFKNGGEQLIFMHWLVRLVATFVSFVNGHGKSMAGTRFTLMFRIRERSIISLSISLKTYRTSSSVKRRLKGRKS